MIIVAALLALVAGAVLIGGWWPFSVRGVLVGTVAIATVMLVIVLCGPTVEILEGWREDQPAVYWLALFVATILSGIVIDIVATWLMGKGPA
jgi:drug/metabolite transporter (DMT)-like permease